MGNVDIKIGLGASASEHVQGLTSVSADMLEPYLARQPSYEVSCLAVLLRPTVYNRRRTDQYRVRFVRQERAFSARDFRVTCRAATISPRGQYLLNGGY